MISRTIAVFLLVILAFGVMSCRQTRTDFVADHSGIRWDMVIPARCTACHGGSDPAAGLNLASWETALEGSERGEVIVAFSPEYSLIYELGFRLPEVLPEGYHREFEIPYEEFRERHRLSETERRVLRNWIDDGARSDQGEVPFEDPDGRLFVAVQDAGLVAVIDPEQHVVQRMVDFSAFGGRMSTPHDTDYEPDGSAWYVTLINAQAIVKLDAVTNEVVDVFDVAAVNPTYKPGMLTVDPGSDRLYLSRSISDLSGGRSIMFLDRSTMTGEEVLVPFTRPHPIALTRDGTRVLSGSLADNLVATIDVETLDLSPPLRIDGTNTPLMHYDVSPDGQLAVITGQFSDLLYVLDISDPEHPKLLHSIPVGREPWYPAFAPDGRLVAVPNHRDNTVSIVDVIEGNPVTTISDSRFAMPHGATISRDGRFLFVSNSNLSHDVSGHEHHDSGDHDMGGWQPRYPLDRDGDGMADNFGTGHVAVIDLTSYEVVRIIELEEFPSGMSLWQRGFPYH